MPPVRFKPATKAKTYVVGIQKNCLIETFFLSTKTHVNKNDEQENVHNFKLIFFVYLDPMPMLTYLKWAIYSSLNFELRLHLHPYFVHVSSKCWGEIVQAHLSFCWLTM